MKNSSLSLLSFMVNIILVLVLFLFSPYLVSPAYGSDVPQEIKIYINNTELQFGTYPSDPRPYIKEGRTLVPFRKIFEALGMEISWNGFTRTVHAKSEITDLELYIGKKYAYVNRIKRELDVAAEITDERTFVPLRFVGESCGCEVIWDEKTRSIFITNSNAKYRLGEEARYKDMVFTVDTLEKNMDEEAIIVNGKINTADKQLSIEIMDSSNQSYSRTVKVENSEAGASSYEYTAKIYVKKTFVPKYIIVKLHNPETKPIKIAEYICQ